MRRPRASERRDLDADRHTRGRANNERSTSSPVMGPSPLRSRTPPFTHSSASAWQASRIDPILDREGAPCRGPRTCPSPTSRSQASASARSVSARSCMTAFRVGLTSAMRAKRLATTSRDDNSRVAMRSARRTTGSSTSSNVEPNSVPTLPMVGQSTSLRALPHLSAVRLQQMMQGDVCDAWSARAKTSPFHGLEFDACVDDCALESSETGRIDMTPQASRRGLR